ncbi:hypothetical protein OZ411_19940 [Bradyrhizobium sp. Arg237L]|uniref:hypothetical protein n=1 Tax=Bradyrhizobium sp. Arg237L TaxID=3003352 RepID=UPI00249F2754|nr:hypothetical protein [Bradyrhizobium sp. Arg237L]MDI4235083.1 hypothetical protein [Bradyrhizobium sp. Arg237L]
MNVSEQERAPIQAEAGASGAGPAAPSAASEPVSASASSEIAANQEETAPKADAPKFEAPNFEAPKSDTPKFEAIKAEAPKVEPTRIEPAAAEPPRTPGKLMIMSPGDRIWDDEGVAAKPVNDEKPASSGNRRFAAMAAVVALATAAGAVGGALATAGLGYYAKPATAAAAVVPPKDTALEASIARIDADVGALKAGLEHASKTGTSQFSKTSDRLDKLEKAQAEPAAKLAKLSETVEKLKAASAAPAPVAAAQPAAVKDVTGSVTPPATTAAAAAPKPEIGRMPTVDGWVLRDVSNGGALIEGRRGLYEVYAGDPIPGLGRVDAIRRQDGRWVVVTSKGLIVAR